MRIQTILFAVLLAVAPAALAGKVVVFNPEIAILATDEAKKRDAQLKSNKEFAALVAKTENIRAEVEALQKNAEKNAMIWGEEQKAEHQKKMAFLTEDYQLAAKKAQAESQSAAMKLMKEYESKLEPVLRKLMEENDIDVILDARVAIMAKPAGDITQEVTKRLNALK